MTHTLILKVKKLQLSGAKRFGTVEENLQGVFPPPYYLGLTYGDQNWQNDKTLNILSRNKRIIFVYLYK